MKKSLAFLDSEEGKKAVEKFADGLNRKWAVDLGRMKRIHSLDDEHFQRLMDYLIRENGDERNDFCYRNGFLPCPTNLLYLMFQAAEQFGEDCSEQDSYFEVWEADSFFRYRGYLFATINYFTGAYRVFKLNEDLTIDDDVINL